MSKEGLPQPWSPSYYGRHSVWKEDVTKDTSSSFLEWRVTTKLKGLCCTSIGGPRRQISGWWYKYLHSTPGMNPHAEQKVLVGKALVGKKVNVYFSWQKPVNITYILKISLQSREWKNNLSDLIPFIENDGYLVSGVHYSSSYHCQGVLVPPLSPWDTP